ncbi:MAG: PQQ-dependent sugar dehydrogenase [Gammaproteobacteria bacterium]|nr:PQQ-dependent sugar dehydrogenase [Gammaproteobacteria bacterium]
MRKVLLPLVVVLIGLVVYIVLFAKVDFPLAALLPDEFRSKPQVSELVTAPGYGISVFAEVPGARVLRMTELGNVVVSSAQADAIFLLLADRDGDGKSDGQRVLLEIENANGIDFAPGYLYVAQEDRIGRVAYDAARDEVVGEYEVIVAGLPAGGNHWRKTIRVGPEDGLLYLAIGSTCNACIEDDDRRAAMLRYTLQGEPLGQFASGLRNTTDIDWSPLDGALYGVDMGRDLLGDDFPPCEVNRIVERGFYGWPFANGNRQPDPDLGAGRDPIIAASSAPVHGFGAHNSPLGIRFLRSDAHPPGYKNAAIVALHGSWNRSDKDGYKVVSLHWTDGRDGPIEERDFVTGFLRDNDVSGRPSGVIEDTRGNVYIADDFANRVYRVSPGAASTVRLAKAPNERGRPATRIAISDEDRAAAAALYESAACAGCHGDVAGQVPLVDLATRYDVPSLQRYLAEPPQPMPAIELAGDRELLARYLLSR